MLLNTLSNRGFTLFFCKKLLFKTRTILTFSVLCYNRDAFPLVILYNKVLLFPAFFFFFVGGGGDGGVVRLLRSTDVCAFECLGSSHRDFEH